MFSRSADIPELRKSTNACDNGRPVVGCETTRGGLCDRRTLARTNTTITRPSRSLTLFLAAAAVRDERGVYITYECDVRVCLCVCTRVPNVFLQYRKQFISCTHINKKKKKYGIYKNNTFCAQESWTDGGKKQKKTVL